MPVATKPLSDTFRVAPQIDVADVAALQAQGIRTILILRPDEEDPSHPQSDAIARAATAQGIETRYLPVPMSGPAPETVEAFRDAMETAPTPILGYCKSGMRAERLWQATTAAPQPQGGILGRVLARLAGR